MEYKVLDKALRRCSPLGEMKYFAPSKVMEDVDGSLFSILRDAAKLHRYIPIEKAPKDGTDLLLWCGWPITGKWHKDNWHTEDGVNVIFHVTHFAHLPAPPQAQEE